MLIYQVTVEGNYDGHNVHADSNAASLWMKRGGTWLNVHFQETPVPTSVSQDARILDEQAIRAADAAWLKAVQAKDVDRIVSFYADDASEFPVAEPIATGKHAIRENWERDRHKTWASDTERNGSACAMLDHAVLGACPPPSESTSEWLVRTKPLARRTLPRARWRGRVEGFEAWGSTRLALR